MTPSTLLPSADPSAARSARPCSARSAAHAVVAAAAVAAAGLAIAPAHAQPAADTLEKVRAAGAITLAYRESSIPFSYLDDKAQPVGFGHEICLQVVEDVKKALGRPDLKVNLQSVTSANRIPLLQNGTIDIECGSTTNNSERGKQVQFATNYFYTGTRFLVKAGTSVQSLDDLKGKTVVSTTGTTNYRILRNLNEERKLGIDLLAAKDHAESALMVESGRAVAFGMDDILLYGLRASSPNPAGLAVVGEPIQVEPYAIMLRRDDPKFKKLVDGTLARLMQGGEFQRLYAKWFQAPIPPKGIVLNAPMSRELLDNLKALSDKPAT